MLITSKARMYELLRTGALGNTFRIWRSTEEFESSGFKGLTGIRASDEPGAPYWHHLTPHQTLYAVSLYEEMGYTPVIYEASPDQHIVMQGEFSWHTHDDLRGWSEPVLYLRYSRAKTHMRAALASDNNYAEGRHAEVLLRHALGQRSWAEVVWLSMIYPEHVIEFTAYDKKVGQKQQTICVWEVRAY